MVSCWSSSSGLLSDRGPTKYRVHCVQYIQVYLKCPAPPLREVSHCLLQQLDLFWHWGHVQSLGGKWVWGCFGGLWWFMTLSKTWQLPLPSQLSQFCSLRRGECPWPGWECECPVLRGGAVWWPQTGNCFFAQFATVGKVLLWSQTMFKAFVSSKSLTEIQVFFFSFLSTGVFNLILVYLGLVNTTLTILISYAHQKLTLVTKSEGAGEKFRKNCWLKNRNWWYRKKTSKMNR